MATPNKGPAARHGGEPQQTNTLQPIMTELPPAGKLPDDSTPIWQLTVGQFKQLVGSSAAPADDAPVPLQVAAEATSSTVGYLRARIRDGQLEAVRGPKQRPYVRISGVRRVLESVPVRPAVRRCVSDGEDPLQALIKSGAVVRGSR